jgi:CHAT domain-containing protein
MAAPKYDFGSSPARNRMAREICGLIGLSRGLLYAGARSLLLSFWDVDDRSTAEFMQLFYSHLARQRDKAQSLRSAMLDLRTRYPHPYYWAPFRLIGKSLS